MLTIKNLKVCVDDKEILKGINLEVKPGEIHAIMGPNGSGKSTLAHVIAGNENYKVTEGSITFLGEDLLEKEVDERAREGIFLAFQYPVEIPGVGNAQFLKSTLNARRKETGREELNAVEILKLIKEKIQLLGMDEKLLGRALNEGFSGGEKKKNEILQMAVMEPKLGILDETDSGLDIDALRIVAEGVNKLRTKDNAFIVVTHYQRILNYIVPDYVHVLHEGKIVKSGDKSLALELEEHGYDQIREHAEAGVTE